MSAPGTECVGVEMILPDLILGSRANQRWQYSGIDSLELCLDKKHFRDYPYPINYQYNSRGFRDVEWPESLQELKQSVWCIGDSFTVGIGQPFEHIWPQVLSRRLQTRTINISMDGASNDWIYRKANRIHDMVDPVLIVVMWSYTHRREHHDQSFNDEQRRLHSSNTNDEQDFLHWHELSQKLCDHVKCSYHKHALIQCTIPNFHSKADSYNIQEHWDIIKGVSWPPCPKNQDEFDSLPESILGELQDFHCCYLTMRCSFDNSMQQTDQNQQLIHGKFFSDIIHIPQRLDRARDYYHFDILTAEWTVDQILVKILDHIVARNDLLSESEN
jgi:hypothetical protein